MRRSHRLFLTFPLAFLMIYTPAGVSDTHSLAESDALQQTRQALNTLPYYEHEKKRYVSPEAIPDAIARASEPLVYHQPATGDALLSIVADREDVQRYIAMSMLEAMVDALSFSQIETLVQVQLTPYVEGKTHYPKGVKSYVGTGYRYGPYLGGAIEKMRTTSYRLLDGVAYGEPFEYLGGRGGSGGISVEGLGYGAHTARAVTDYELTYQKKTIFGSVSSPLLTFEIVQNVVPNMLDAPRDLKLSTLIRRVCRFVETKDTQSKDYLPSYLDPWKPSGTSRSRIGSPDIYALHMPMLEVSESLPVDLCFDVEIHVMGTGEIFKGDSLVVPRGRHGFFEIVPDDRFGFARLREGYIEIKAILEPSRAIALTRGNISKYYAGVLRSPVMRAKTYWFHRASAKPWLLELGSKAKALEDEGLTAPKTVAQIQNMTSLDDYKRLDSIFDIGREKNFDPEPMFPFLIELLQDSRTSLPTQPADLAQDVLIAVGAAAIDSLITALVHKNVGVRTRAATALGLIPDPRGVSSLVAALNDPEPEMRQAVIVALGRLGSPHGEGSRERPVSTSAFIGETEESEE